jgi:hypothetical protein
MYVGRLIERSDRSRWDETSNEAIRGPSWLHLLSRSPVRHHITRRDADIATHCHVRQIGGYQKVSYKIELYTTSQSRRRRNYTQSLRSRSQRPSTITMSSRYEERDDRYRSDDLRRDRDRGRDQGERPSTSDRHRTRDRDVDDREPRRRHKDDNAGRKDRDESKSRSRSRERHSKRRRDRSESRERGDKEKKKRHRSVPSS